MVLLFLEDLGGRTVLVVCTTLMTLLPTRMSFGGFGSASMNFLLLETGAFGWSLAGKTGMEDGGSSARISSGKRSGSFPFFRIERTSNFVCCSAFLSDGGDVVAVVVFDLFFLASLACSFR